MFNPLIILQSFLPSYYCLLCITVLVVFFFPFTFFFYFPHYFYLSFAFLPLLPLFYFSSARVSNFNLLFNYWPKSFPFPSTTFFLNRDPQFVPSPRTDSPYFFLSYFSSRLLTLFSSTSLFHLSFILSSFPPQLTLSSLTLFPPSDPSFT